jgi:hypothetical protein
MRRIASPTEQNLNPINDSNFKLQYSVLDGEISWTQTEETYIRTNAIFSNYARPNASNVCLYVLHIQELKVKKYVEFYNFLTIILVINFKDI